LVEQERARHYELETSLEATEVAREQALAESVPLSLDTSSARVPDGRF